MNKSIFKHILSFLLLIYFLQGQEESVVQENNDEKNKPKTHKIKILGNYQEFQDQDYQQLKQFFSSFDLNKDEHIDIEELRQINVLFEDIKPEKKEALCKFMFKSADQDNDQKLNFSEFLSLAFFHQFKDQYGLNQKDLDNQNKETNDSSTEKSNQLGEDL